MEENTTPAEKPVEKQEEEETIIVAPQREYNARSLEDICIEYAKRFNGFPYISASTINSYDDKTADPKKTSTLARRLKFAFMLSGRTDVNEFVKNFVGQPIVYIQAHAEMPILSEDGAYSAVNVHGIPIKTKNISEHIILNTKTFKPFIIVKQEGGKFGKIEGNPYCDISKDQAQTLAEILQQSQEEQK